MSVVTFCLSSFSGRTTQFTLMLGFCCSNAGVSFCMMIMSGLLTVAIVIVVACPGLGDGVRRVLTNTSNTTGTSNLHFGMLTPPFDDLWRYSSDQHPPDGDAQESRMMNR